MASLHSGCAAVRLIDRNLMNLLEIVSADSETADIFLCVFPGGRGEVREGMRKNTGKFSIPRLCSIQG
jgi:hypothetical protein